MPTGQRHPPELRARVVAEVVAGDSIRAVAKRWGIPYPTAQAWWREDRPTDTTDARTQRRMVDQLYDTAFDCLDAVRATAGLFQDPAWTRAQTAEGLAVLVGVLSDRTVRMLGGLRPAEPDDQARGPALDAPARPPDDGVPLDG